MKTLSNTKASQAKDNVHDIELYGVGDLFKCLSKAWSRAEGWMKSTKAMNVPGGVVIQVSTQQGDHVAEALTFVPGVAVVEDGDAYALAPVPELREVVRAEPGMVMLQRLWSKAVGTDGYDKSEWMELEAELLRAAGGG